MAPRALGPKHCHEDPASAPYSSQQPSMLPTFSAPARAAPRLPLMVPAKWPYLPLHLTPSQLPS